MGVLPAEEPGDRAYRLACRIVHQGLEGARFRDVKPERTDEVDCPLKIYSVGKLKTIERFEVDSLTSIQRLLKEHVQNSVRISPGTEPLRPLCLAVFGAPGSGKSYGVKQIADDLRHTNPRVGRHPIEYNVSQFTNLKHLADALHEVRDHCLRGVIPLVIFDEFDAAFDQKSFGWLQYFLMPMQDGKFRDGSTDYHIGNCIMVFAGGINHNFSEFSGRQRDPGFCSAKGPDFISRLRGIHNVPSLNREDDTPFPGWQIKRAILLNTYLSKKQATMKDPALLRAFLKVGRYLHGARSLEAIVDMSVANSVGVIDRSSLPRRDQLDLHVDAQEFWRLILMGETDATKNTESAT